MSNLSPIEELLTKLRQQIGDAEIEAAMDLLRMDEEHKERKDLRWRRMLDETRYLRGQCDALIHEMASMRAHEAVIAYHGDVDGDCDL